MIVKSFFHPQTFTLTYLVYDEQTKDALIIDPVVDYNPKSSTLSLKSAQLMIDVIEALGLNICYILETHAHADHLTGAQALKEKYPNAIVGIGENIKAVQNVFEGLLQLGKETEGKSFDFLLRDGEMIEVGGIKVEVLSTPGHTPACVTYLINGEALFTGDLLFAPDFGTGRCDFPGGSSEDMYNSLQRIYSLEGDYKVYPGHDYMPGGRIVWDQAPLSLHRKENTMFNENTSKEEFIANRNARDSKLEAPNILLQSVQFNAWGGELPREKTVFLKMPLRIKG
ncbi:unnamed protein product [Chrysoparadoxa australica]